MKKIGIITLTASDNVGSLLQAYALQNTIEKDFGYETELLDFECKKSKKLYSIFKPGLIKNPKKLMKTIKNYSILSQQKKDYNDFRKKHFNLTEKKYQTSTELRGIKDKYDKIVCGSDQIWNVEMYDFDEAYFLGWADGVNKISYAASLGGQKNTEPKQELIKFKKEIEMFDYISVREEQGKETLDRFVDKKIELCADPTLIIDPKVWDDLTKKRLINEEYIFYYSYSYSSKELNEVVSKASKFYGLPVYVINASKWTGASPKDFGFTLCEKGGPEAFLNLMRYSKYSFVESLHGTIFAYIFKRNFWFLNSRKVDELDHRSEFILKSMNLRNRVVRPNNFSQTNFEENIDYENLNSQMADWIIKSRKFLKNALESSI